MALPNAQEYLKQRSQGKSDTVAWLTKKKNLPSEVAYRPSPDSHQQCMDCVNYEKPGEEKSPCSKIVGMVEAEATCDLFVQREEEIPTGQDLPNTSVVININP